MFDPMVIRQALALGGLIALFILGRPKGPPSAPSAQLSFPFMQEASA
jgi:hypothetical protein